MSRADRPAAVVPARAGCRAVQLRMVRNIISMLLPSALAKPVAAVAEVEILAAGVIKGVPLHSSGIRSWVRGFTKPPVTTRGESVRLGCQDYADDYCQPCKPALEALRRLAQLLGT